jgi:hypothetical protein
MRIRAAFLVGAGFGYLVGTAVGRQQVERIAARVNGLLGETRPWSGPVRTRPVDARRASAATIALSVKVVDAARAAACAAAAAAPRVIVRPPAPRMSNLGMSYRMPSQRNRRGDDGDGEAHGPLL